MMRCTVILILVLGLCLPAAGVLTRKVQYIDPTATGANDGSSWTNAYASIVTWEAQNTDLVAADQYLQVYCRGGVDNLTAGLVCVGWPTDATRDIELIEDPNNYHDGLFPTGSAYYVKYTGSGVATVVTISQPYLTWNGIPVQGKRTSAYTYNLMVVDNQPGIVVKNSLFWDQVNGAYGAITVATGTATGRYIYNNIIYDSTVGIKVVGNWVSGGAIHNTIVDCPTYGIYMQSGSSENCSFRNNLVSGSGTDWYETYPSAAHLCVTNYVSDTSLPAGQETYESSAVVFVDAGAKNYHLDDDQDTLFPCSDPSITGTTVDIDGQTRQWGSVGEAGADEIPTVSTYVPPFGKWGWARRRH